MNVIYRAHGAGGFIWKRRARTRLSELPGRKLRHPARWLWYLLPGLAGIRCAGSFRTDPWFPGSYNLY